MGATLGVAGDSGLAPQRVRPRLATGRVLAGLRAAVGLGFAVPLGMRWIERGNGSTFNGVRLASALLHSDPVGTWGRLGGAGIFVLALIGAACIAMSPFRHPAVHVAFVVFGAAVVASLAIVVGRSKPPPANWGPGLFLVATSALLALVTGVVGLWSERSGRRGATSVSPGAPPPERIRP